MARQCPPGTVAYTIQAGDTFYSLALRYQTTIPAIVSANPALNPDLLQVGQIICLPVRQPEFPPCPELLYNSTGRHLIWNCGPFQCFPG